jgi:hypothetical protein
LIANPLAAQTEESQSQSIEVIRGARTQLDRRYTCGSEKCLASTPAPRIGAAVPRLTVDYPIPDGGLCLPE